MKDSKFKAGEKGFAVFLLLFGLYFFGESVKLYKMDARPSSFGAVPLFLSGLIIIFSLVIIISDRKKISETKGMSLGEKAWVTLRYILPKDVLVIVIFIVLYCIGLYLGIGFILGTSIFLLGSMTYLMKKNFVKNIFWTACSMIFIVVVFKYIFSVVLP